MLVPVMSYICKLSEEVTDFADSTELFKVES